MARDTPSHDADKGETKPGDAAGVVVPNEHAAPATSEEFTAVDGVMTYPRESDPDDQQTTGPSD